jgi:hypothetical protein
MSNLDQLRSNPNAWFQVYDAYVDATGYACATDGREQVGGPCTLGASSSSTLVTITVGSAAGRDYYFPWKPRGVGLVKVPASAPDGTIVVTGGMNGCSIEVIQQGGGTLVFYHDADGCMLRNVVPPVDGDTIFSSRYRDYAPHETGFNMVNGLRAQRSFLYQFVFVKKGSIWMAFVSGIVLAGSHNVTISGSFRDAPDKCIGTFTKAKKD